MKKESRKRFRAAVRILLVMMGVLAVTGCHKKEKGSIYQAQTGQQEEKTGGAEKETAFRLYLGEISAECSPFEYFTAGDERLLSLVYSRVQEVADISVEQNTPEKGRTRYRITLRQELRDKNGNCLTADALLFNYYLRCQTNYRGCDTVNEMKIVGLEEYQYGVRGKKLQKRRKKVREMLKYPTKELANALRKEIVLPELKREYAWTQTLYFDSSQDELTGKYPQISMLFARYFAADTTYTGKNKTRKQVLLDIARQYGGNLKGLSRVTGKEYTGAARAVAIQQLYGKQGGGDGKISGIRKRDDTTVEIVTEGYQKEDRQRLGEIFLLSRFPSCGQKDTEQFPLGCGEYYVAKQNSEKLVLCSNSNAWQGKPQIEELFIDTGKERGKGEGTAVRCVKKIAEDELDMAVVWERVDKEKKSIRQILGTGDNAWKVAAQGGVLYSTQRVNGTTIPEKMTPDKDVISNMGNIKRNK